ncbi:MAG: hypothetical protein PHU64_05265 [Candidatus Omnitrophica bacterium]|nr:hypothetical protein [Candidatus Omnitrophota bacterium]MDD5430549.1 hypothetical protein [Candidatus Omnitrophota bacterium]
MIKTCYLCGKELTENVILEFFPEDDTYICKKCLESVPADRIESKNK